MNIYLSNENIIKGKFFNIVERLFNRNKSEFKSEIDGYKVAKNFNEEDSQNNGRAGIFVDQKGNRTLIKQHNFKYKDLDYYYIQNEYNVLKALNNLIFSDDICANVPTVEFFKEDKNSLSFATKYIEGEKLSTFSNDVKMQTLRKCFNSLKLINQNFETLSLDELPQRTSATLTISYILYVLKAILKNPLQVIFYAKTSVHFYELLIKTYSLANRMEFTHRDLDFDNIIIEDSTNTAFLCDWENAIMASKFTDLSYVLRIYFTLLSPAELLSLVNEQIQTKQDAELLVMLSIYNTVQTAAVDNKSLKTYKDCVPFLKLLLNKIEPTLLKQNSTSLTEVIYLSILKIVTLVHKAIPSLNNKSKVKAVLAYHSIATDGWKYSITPELFETHLKFIHENLNFITAEQYLNENKNGIVLTFDDGYENLLGYALPLSQELNISPIVFVIGDKSNANYEQLDNNNNLLDIDQIKRLQQVGWEIGYHSKTHANLVTLDESALKSEVAIPQEIKGIKYFAYPKGDFNKTVITEVKNAGYTAAFSDDGTSSTFNKFARGRLATENIKTTEQLDALLSPLGIAVTNIFNTILKIKSKIKFNLNFLNETTFIGLLMVSVAFVLLLSLRGFVGNPTITDLNSHKWVFDGPMELSPERGRYALTYSIVEDHSLYFAPAVAEFAIPDLGTFKGHFVSLFAPAVSFIVAPGYIIGKSLGVSQLGTFAVVALFALFNCLLIYKICRLIGSTIPAAAFAFLAFIFGSPAFSYAVTLYQHHISTFLILAGIYLLLKYENFWSVALIWFLCAFSISVDYPNFFMMLPIGIFAIGKFINSTREGDKLRVNFKILYIFTFVLAIFPMLFFFWFNKSSYGSPFQLAGTVDQVKDVDVITQKSDTSELADQDKIESKTDVPERSAIAFFNTRDMLNGMYILFLSPDRGMISFAPIIMVGFLGLIVAYKKKVKGTTVIFSVLMMNIVLYSMWGDPWGGWAFGARYLIPGYALLAIFLGVLLTHVKKKYLLIPLLLLFIYSAYINTAGAITTGANPPQVEVLALEKTSGVVQKYTYERNIDDIKAGGTKAFFYHAFLTDKINVDGYFAFLVSFITLISTEVFVYYLLEKHETK